MHVHVHVWVHVCLHVYVGLSVCMRVISALIYLIQCEGLLYLCVIDVVFHGTSIRVISSVFTFPLTIAHAIYWKSALGDPSKLDRRKVFLVCVFQKKS